MQLRGFLRQTLGRGSQLVEHGPLPPPRLSSLPLHLPFAWVCVCMHMCVHE